MRSKKRRLWLCSSALALSALALLAAGSASAGGRGDYWDPRNSIPARVIDTHLGVIGLAATIAGDYRTAAVVDHISGRFAGPAPIVVQQVHYPAPVVEHHYYPPPRPVVEHHYYSPPRPVVVHHVHGSGCGHSGYGYDRGHRHGHGRGHRGEWDDDDRDYGRRGYGGYRR